MKKKLGIITKIIIQVIVALLATAFVVAGTIFVYYYAKGYRIDLKSRDLRKTGVINVESRPSKANITINGEKNGKTPKTVASLDDGTVDVKLTRSGYLDWNKKVPILSEKSTPIIAELFKEEPEVTQQIELSADSQLHTTIKSLNGEVLIYLTKSPKNVYTLWRYDLNKSFWNLSNNPHIVSSFTGSDIKNIRILLSPSGQNLVVLYAKTEKKVVTNIINLYNTQLTETTGHPLALTKFTTDYILTWSESENYIILDSTSDILAFNITNQAKYLLYKKAPDEKVVWTTDSQNNFYYTQKSLDEAGGYLTLEQSSLDGTGSKTLIPRIYYSNDEGYIEALRRDDAIHSPFTNSPQNTRFVGEISSIKVNQDTKGIFLSTQYSSYWYVTEVDKYIVINPYETTFLSFSPNNRSLLFTDVSNKKVGVFTFIQEVSNPIKQLGSKIVLRDADDLTNIDWISSTNISYQKGDSVNLIDKDGDNNYEIKITSSPHIFSFTGGGKYVHTIETIEENLKLTKYTIQ
ncbi:PEGA domain-containing protein [Candidatus Dojkabacteria bacterium]|nr:PEGA domain-containing protein [Candidatus Dojkabacteria bacterium]